MQRASSLHIVCLSVAATMERRRPHGGWGEEGDLMVEPFVCTRGIAGKFGERLVCEIQ